MLDIDRLLELAIATARRSPSRPRKVGAVLVLADGATTLAACNDFPVGVRDTEARHAHPDRLLWIEHAERNAIFAAARSGLADGRRDADRDVPSVCRLRPCDRAGRHRDPLHIGAGSSPTRSGATRSLCSRTVLEEGGVQVIHLDRDAALMHALTLGTA